MKKKIIFSSFKESFKTIKKNRMVFLVLFLLQLLFFSLMFFVNLYYQPKIMDSVINVMDYVSKQNPADGETILGEDPLMIHNNYEEMVYNLSLLAVWCFFIFVFVNGSIFYLISKLIYDKNFNFKICFEKYKENTKEFFVYLLKFGIVCLIFFLLIFLFLYSTFKGSLFSMVNSIGSFNPASLLIAVVLAYFMYISFSLLYKVKKNIFRKLFDVGAKKAHIILLTYFINLVIILILFLLITLLIEANLILITLVILLSILAFVWSKIFLVSVVKKLG